MARHQPIIITPRPVDTGDTKWRRFLDTVLFRRDLRERLAASRIEVEQANDRRTEGASAAHDGMFKIESLGVLSSEVSVRKDRGRHERTAVVEIAHINNEIGNLLYAHETVSFEGQTYVVSEMATDPYMERSYYGGEQQATLTLRGVVFNN